MGEADSYLDGYGIINIALTNNNWTDITFPVNGVKYFEIQEQTGTMAIDYRKSATETAEWRINVGCIRPCHRDHGPSRSGGQVRRVSASTTNVQVYYEY